MSKSILSIAVLSLTASASAFAQLSPAATWAAQFANNYAVTPNVTYLVANNYEAKLDVYARRNTTVNFSGSAAAGDLVEVRIEGATSTTLRGVQAVPVAA